VTAAERIGVAAQIACLLEASAAKPGNVHPGAPFADARYEDFLLSGAAIGPAMAAAGEASVGAVIRRAVRATRHTVRANTNLGIVLLLAPLAKAAATLDPRDAEHDDARCPALRDAIRRVLDGLDVEDAREAYAAIREAAPGGLGSAEAQDVAGEPTVTLREAMALAAERDSVAREYVTDYALTFERTVPALERARRAGLIWPDAVVQAYLEVLAARSRSK
jgi:triphosphoribosyl-dephospho-CoA synthase